MLTTSSVAFASVVETCVRVIVASVAAAPFRVSFASTSLIAVPPEAPLLTVPLSSVATIGAAPTVTTTSAVSQLVGLSCSQIW